MTIFFQFILFFNFNFQAPNLPNLKIQNFKFRLIIRIFQNCFENIWRFSNRCMLFSYLENVDGNFGTVRQRFHRNCHERQTGRLGVTFLIKLICWSKFLSSIQEANCSDFIINYEEWIFNGTDMSRISATIDATLSHLGEELSSCYFLGEKMITLSVWIRNGHTEISRRFPTPGLNEMCLNC